MLVHESFHEINPFGKYNVTLSLERVLFGVLNANVQVDVKLRTENVLFRKPLQPKNRIK